MSRYRAKELLIETLQSRRSGHTQTSLGFQTGLTQSFISGVVCAGNTFGPKTKVRVAALCDLLGVPEELGIEEVQR